IVSNAPIGSRMQALLRLDPGDVHVELARQQLGCGEPDASIDVDLNRTARRTWAPGRCEASAECERPSEQRGQRGGCRHTQRLSCFVEVHHGMAEILEVEPAAPVPVDGCCLARAPEAMDL